MDVVTLSRIETEWLVACFYEGSRGMPRPVHERLKSHGLIEGSHLTPEGLRWLRAREQITQGASRRA